MLKRTPLFEAHQRLGARLVEFGGWEMPVQYSSIIEEHEAVRTAAGLFDISHMGEILAAGPAAVRFLDEALTNEAARLQIGQAQYSLLCLETGGTVDDVYVYRIGADSFLLVVNASRIAEDFSWLQSQWRRFAEKELVSLRDCSGQFAAAALQGPRAAEIIDRACADGLAPLGPLRRPSQLKKNEISPAGFSLGANDPDGFVARTGYTGEDGFEIVAPAAVIEPIWTRLLRAGGDLGLKPAGLGARDTLRTEMGYPLYGHELSESITPIEAGLGYFVAFNKPQFVGRARLLEQKESGAARKGVAFKMAERSAPPRPHYAIWSAGASARRIGEVTSGTMSPSLGIGIGLGLVEADAAQAGTEWQIEIRGRRARAVATSKPIYRKAV